MAGRQRRNNVAPGVKIGHAVDRRGASGFGSLALGWMLFHGNVMFGIHIERQYCLMRCV